MPLEDATTTAGPTMGLQAPATFNVAMPGEQTSSDNHEATSGRHRDAVVLRYLVEALSTTKRLKIVLPSWTTSTVAAASTDDPISLLVALEASIADALRCIQTTVSVSTTTDVGSLRALGDIGVGGVGVSDAFGTGRSPLSHMMEHLSASTAVAVGDSSGMMISFCSETHPLLTPSGPTTPHQYERHTTVHAAEPSSNPSSGRPLPPHRTVGGGGTAVSYDHVPDGNIAEWLNETFAPAQRRRRSLASSRQAHGGGQPGGAVGARASLSMLSGPSVSQRTSDETVPTTNATTESDALRTPVGTAGSSAASTSLVVTAAQEIKFVRSAERPVAALQSAAETTLMLEQLRIPLIGDVNSPDFNVVAAFDTHGAEDAMVFVALNVFARYSFVTTLALDVARLAVFLRALRRAYGDDNPYHNAMHAADVLQTVHIFLSVNDMRENFTDVELLALLFSAVVHDVGHVGVSNAFLQNIRHPLAMLFNDQSVLESAHAAAAFALLLEHDGCNFFPQPFPVGADSASAAGDDPADPAAVAPPVTREMYDDFRGLVIECLLATDMKHHSEHSAMVRGILRDGRVLDGEINKLLRAMLHMADISNAMKPYDTYLAWVVRVMAEFWMQGDAEAARGMKISLLCDRRSAAVGKSQHGFIQFVVRPFVDEMAVIMPSVWLQRLHANAERMKALPADEEDAILARVRAMIGDRQWVDGSTSRGSSNEQRHDRLGLMDVLRDVAIASEADNAYVRVPGAFGRCPQVGAPAPAPVGTPSTIGPHQPTTMDASSPLQEDGPRPEHVAAAEQRQAKGLHLPPLRAPRMPTTARVGGGGRTTTTDHTSRSAASSVLAAERRQLRDVVPTPAWMSLLGSPRQ